MLLWAENHFFFAVISLSHSLFPLPCFLVVWVASWVYHSSDTKLLIRRSLLWFVTNSFKGTKSNVVKCFLPIIHKLHWYEIYWPIVDLSTAYFCLLVPHNHYLGTRRPLLLLYWWMSDWSHKGLQSSHLQSVIAQSWSFYSCFHIVMMLLPCDVAFILAPA